MIPSSWPLWAQFAIFLLAASAILVAGWALAGLADRVADRTGLGEAMTGAILLGAVTSLPGIAATLTAAVGPYPSMAVSNALGGIAVQTAFLALADIAYRGTNLEHAAASLPNMLQSALLVLLLTLILLGLSGPEVTVGVVHPVTFLLPVALVWGYRLAWRTRSDPMWRPQQTRETVPDVPAPEHRRESLGRLLAATAAAAAVVLVAGVVIARTTEHIVALTGISATVAGALLMAVSTSLPELVTTVTAVRRGALTLAVSDIVGGNMFDVLFICLADAVYLEGSIYHAPGVGRQEIFLNTLTILLAGILLVGLLFRQKRGPGNIGFESVLMLLVYVAGFLILSLAM